MIDHIEAMTDVMGEGRENEVEAEKEAETGTEREVGKERGAEIEVMEEIVRKAERGVIRRFLNRETNEMGAMG